MGIFNSSTALKTLQRVYNLNNNLEYTEIISFLSLTSLYHSDQASIYACPQNWNFRLQSIAWPKPKKASTVNIQI